MGMWVILLVLLWDQHHKGLTKDSLQMGGRFGIKGDSPLELMGNQVSISLSS